MSTKKYVSLARLTQYDEKIKALMEANDAAALDAAKKYAKEYADGLADNYDAAGSAATAESNAIAKVNELANGAVATNTTAISNIKDDANVDSFADVVAELAKKQDKGDYATKSEAQGYANAKDSAIAEAKAAGDAAQGTANANAQAIEAINNAETGVLAQAKSFATTEDAKVQGAVDALAGKVGTVAEGKTVMGIIAEIQENAYDDTEIQGKIDGVSGKVDTLIGSDSGKSARTIANEELAKQLIPEGAKEALNELQEIAAWIQSHPDDASAMNEAIVAIQNQLTGIDAGNGTVKKYVDDAIAALKIGDYAKASELAELAGRVSALETASATHALKSEVEAVSKSLSDYETAHAGDYTNAQIDAAIKVNTDAIANLNNTYATDAELTAAIDAEVERSNGAYAAKGLETTVSQHTGNTVAHTTSDEKALWNAALQASDITTGTANGAIAVKGVDVAVKGLGSAAFTASTAYDAAGSAAAVEGKLNEEIAKFVEVTSGEIDALFAQF